MDLKRYPVDFGSMTRRSLHEKMINQDRTNNPWRLHPNTNPNTEMHSALNMYKVRTSQTPNNFIGIKTIRAPPVFDKRYDPKPMDGVYKAEDHVKVLRTLPVLKYFSVNI